MHRSIYVKYAFNILDHQHTKKNPMRTQRGRNKQTKKPQNLFKISNFQELQNVQKINVLVGQVTEVFSFFTVTMCIVVLIKTYQYITNTSCSSHTTVLLPGEHNFVFGLSLLPRKDQRQLNFQLWSQCCYRLH